MGIPDEQKYLCVIAGPTAAGKTELAIRIAQHFSTEIISADSRQFYRELNIGTAKPDATQLSSAPHHMINNKSVDTLYGAGDFAADALDLLAKLYRKHRIVIVAGGSGLYIESLLYGMDDFGKVPPSVRDELNRSYEKKGLAWLQEQVRKADPEYYRLADIRNPQRLIRALEVCVHTGKPFSAFLSAGNAQREFVPIRILLSPGRNDLYERINRRTEQMMSEGLLEEARSLYPHRQHNALRTVGYKELFDYIDGKCSLQQAVEMIKQHTRNYAKRQLTWFRNRDQFTEFLPSQEKEIIAFIESRMKGRDAAD